MYLFLKRSFDIIFSLIGLIILAPLLLPIMIVLLMTAEHYVFFFQKRLGYKNKYFNIWKFATMLKNSSNMLTGSLTVRNDPRVTTIGKYLRNSKINELPQLFNVLLGEMSFVGPRPQMKVDFEAYSKEVQEKIYDAKPGITGIGSIFFRDEEKWISGSTLEPKEFYKLHIAPYKGTLELWYLKNRSLLVDIKLLFITAWVILFPNSQLLEYWFDNLPKMPKEFSELETIIG